MFERNNIDSHVEKGSVSVKITLDDGRELSGKFIISINKSLFDILNAPGGFIEFEAFGGNKEFIAKRSLRAVQLLSVPRGDQIQSRLRSLDGFDPYKVLGVERGADWPDIRQAYLGLARAYHPDRYSTAQLPEEIRSYLATMVQRINAAYGALESQREEVKKIRNPVSEPIYTSRPGR